MKSSSIIFFAILFQLIASKTFSQDSLYYVTSFHGSSNADQLYKAYGVGDINEDGLSDFVVTYLLHSDLYYGSNNMKELKPAHIFRCWNSSFVGDVNGDGINDLMTIGKNTADLKDPYTSDIITIYFGGKELDTVPKFSFKFPYYFNMLYALGENIGDINGDGYGDFMISSPYNWSDGKGFIYVFLGGKTLSNIPILKLECKDDSLSSITPTIFVGEQMVGIGDCNKDGYDDFLVGTSTLGGNGRVYLYYGGNTLSDQPAKILYDPVYKGASYFGEDIRNAGDLNKDGRNDFIITGGDHAYIYLSLDSIVTINAGRYGFGGYVGLGTGGDINGDGYNDFLVSNTNHLNSQKVMVGMANVFYGGSTIDTVEKASMEGTGKWFEYGKYMCIPGDINGDGYAEVFIHEPSWPDFNDQNAKGKVTLYSYKKLTDAVEENNSSPEDFNLLQNFPNPFNPSTTIDYSIRIAGNVKLSVFDALGKRVAVVVDEYKPAGSYRVKFDGHNLPSGVYLYRLESGDYNTSKKFILMK